MCQVVVLLSVHLQIDPQLRGWIYSPAPLKKSPRNPGQTVHASAPSKRVYLLLICHWRGRRFRMPRSPSVPAPLAKSFLCPFTHCLPTRLSETKIDCGGRRRGRSWAVHEPRHPESEQRAGKVECESRTQQHMPVWKEIAYFQSERRSGFEKRRILRGIFGGASGGLAALHRIQLLPCANTAVHRSSGSRCWEFCRWSVRGQAQMCAAIASGATFPSMFFNQNSS